MTDEARTDKVGFLTMGDAVAASGAPSLGIGMLGYAFMGKAHTNALKKLPYMVYPPPAVPRLVAIAGRTGARVREAAHRYGYTRAYTDWRALIDDPEVDVFDNAGPNDLHADPNIAAAQVGKHVISEKPLGRTAAEAHAMWQAARKARISILKFITGCSKPIPGVCYPKNVGLGMPGILQLCQVPLL